MTLYNLKYCLAKGIEEIPTGRWKHHEWGYRINGDEWIGQLIFSDYCPLLYYTLVRIRASLADSVRGKYKDAKIPPREEW